MIAVDSRLRRTLPLLLALSVLAACSGSPQLPQSGSQAIVNPERGTRGNPTFYDVLGERYYVLDSSEGFRQTGIASWYGRDFHGKETSSGEVYDMRELTAAHKTLPIPTWVEVTNLDNGRQVVVKVNDRGPFVDGRIIDLSQRAAEELDMIREGTARVRIRALGAPAAEPVFADSRAGREQEQRGRGFSIISEADADSVDARDRAFRPLYVQVGAFADPKNAARLVDRLKDEGIRDSFVLTTGRGSERLHRVRIGPIADSSEFDRIRANLRAAGVYDSRLVQDN